MALHAQELALHPLALSPRQEKQSPAGSSPATTARCRVGFPPGLQLWKAEAPRKVRDVGRVMDVSSPQSAKALSPILTRLFGSARDVSPTQPRKAMAPMVVRDSGSSMDVSLEQEEKTPSVICFTPEGTMTAGINNLSSRNPTSAFFWIRKLELLFPIL